MAGIRKNFYPRSPCGERHRHAYPFIHKGYFYPRSPCGERRGGGICWGSDGKISIHALLAESDLPRMPLRHPGSGFLSTLSLRRATHFCLRLPSAFRFLSTLSLRRATAFRKLAKHVITDFYPRSPCGERRGAGSERGEPCRFLSTLSLRRATSACLLQPTFLCISIHALLAESDPLHLAVLRIIAISIHALLAESDLKLGQLNLVFHKFLSTLSLRRATCGGMGRHWQIKISIHALLAESDVLPDVYTRIRSYFYPRSPCGERRRGA